MSTTAIAATNAYRHKVALTAAAGGALPKAAWVAFGAGARPYTLDDIAMEAEFFRVSSNNSVDGVQLTVAGVLTGIDAGAHVLREVGVFSADGTLMGRRVLTPKELEPETQLEIELVFQY